MKLILFGATGYIGGNVLAAALADSRVKEVLIVSRRAIPHLDDGGKVEGKATVIILEDFAVYPPDVVERLGSADACIWCLGSYDGDEKVEITYPKVFFEAITGSVEWRRRRRSKRWEGKDLRFGFVYLGGAFTVTEQEGKLWYLQTARRVRGRAQMMVVEWENEPVVQGVWRSVVVRPAAVLNFAREQTWVRWLAGCVLGDGLCVAIGEVACVMVEIAVGGVSVEMSEQGRLVENREVVRRGRELLALKKGETGGTQ